MSELAESLTKLLTITSEDAIRTKKPIKSEVKGDVEHAIKIKAVSAKPRPILKLLPINTIYVQIAIIPRPLLRNQ
jgi:hypothetical protein